MVQRLRMLPLLILLIGATGLAMLVPSAVAFALRDAPTGRAFLYSAGLVCVVALLLAAAIVPGRSRAAWVRDTPLFSVIAAFVLLPPVMALPVADAISGLRFVDAWFEMLSSFTTTGASLFDAPREIASAVHLWRAIAGWLGGLLVLAAAFTLLGPQDLDSFGAPGRPAGDDGMHGMHLHARSGTAHPVDGDARIMTDLSRVAPVYAAISFGLWVALMIAGNPPLLAAIQSMSAISTSGILPARSMGPAGFWAEALVFLAMLLALTRRSLPAPRRMGDPTRLWRDPELRLAVLLVALVGMVILLRHWAGAAQVAEGDNLPAAGRALWGGAFTALSFLTTTGFVSHDWVAARAWSGLTSPGLILLGLALVGGGVATTAGGVKLIRVYALGVQGRRELEKLVHPASVGGRGGQVRMLRREGAFRAWLFLMVFLFTLIAVKAALLLTGLSFETALVYAMAALTTTGPLTEVAAGAPLSWAALSDPARAVLGLAMVLGRLELLLVLMLVAGRLTR